MPEESQTFFDEPTEQPIEESVEKEEKAEQPEVTPEEEPQEGIEGTTFKSAADLAKAYKEIQGTFTRQSQELKEAKQLLKDFSTHLTKPQAKEVKKAYSEDPEQFMKDFIADPFGTINKAIEEAQGKVLGPIQGELRAASSNIELQTFLSKHPELTDEDVEPFMEIMDRYPEFRQRKDRLESWLKLLKVENPAIAERTTQKKEQLELGASDAKKAAGVSPRKSSLPKQTGKGDEFDDVLDMWKARREKMK